MKELRSYLLENEEELFSVVRELNSYNGSLEHLDFLENEKYMFNCLFGNLTSYELATKLHYSDYNINDDYFLINVYGHIISYSEYDAIQEIKEYIDDVIESLLKFYDNIEVNSKLAELIENALNEED